MKRGSFAASFLTCLLLAGVTTTAYAAGIMAERSHHRIVVDGKEAQMEAYVINGSNYVRLRDIGKAVGFEVYWDGDAKCVQVESGKPYTGIAPVKAETSGPASQPEATTPADDVDAMKQDIVDRTNALRRENGVAVLRVNDKLMQAAQVRANEMATHTVYSHTRPDGRKFNTATDCPYMAENIHRIADWVLSDQTLAERAATDWYASTVHHKYNNRMMAISAAVMTTGTLDEAKAKITELTGQISLNPSDRELLKCDSKVLCGMLFGKIMQAQMQHIQLQISIAGSFLHRSLSESDWIDLLGILLDNALEASSDGDTVYLQAEDEVNALLLLVSNPCPPISRTEMTEMFRRGWSTKADQGRGYGLSNVRKMVEQHGGKIIVKNEEKNGQNYLTIGALIS